jgi:hypothetical protein
MFSMFRKSALTAFALIPFAVAMNATLAQNTGEAPPPVIDVHVHAMDESFPGMAATCPNTARFLRLDTSKK